MTALRSWAAIGALAAAIGLAWWAFEAAATRLDHRRERMVTDRLDRATMAAHRAFDRTMGRWP